LVPKFLGLDQQAPVSLPRLVSSLIRGIGQIRLQLVTPERTRS
jgi:hypothetical protein